MGLRNTASYWPFTLDALNEATPMQLATDYRHLQIDVDASSVTTGFTLTVYKSNQEDRPDLSEAASATNNYKVVEAVFLDNWDGIDGSTGIVISADGFYGYEINDNKARWVWVKITARTDWTASVNFSFADNS